MSAMSRSSRECSAAPGRYRVLDGIAEQAGVHVARAPMSLTGGLSQHPLHPDRVRVRRGPRPLNDAQHTVVQGAKRRPLSLV